MAGTLRTLLALIIFPTLTALGFYHTFGLLKLDGTLKTLRGSCLPSTTTTPPTFTGVPAVDAKLCVLVQFFNIMISSSNDALPFLTYGLGISLPLVVLPLVEAYKTGRSRFVGFPAVWGLVSQVAAVGVVYPLYFLAVTLSTSGERKPSSARSLTTAEAQAIIFGVLIGAVIPSVAMIMTNDPGVIVLWQFYPLLVSLASFGHLIWRPKKTFSQPGVGLMQVLYLGTFIVSSSVHIATVWPMFQREGLDAVAKFFLPTATPLPSTVAVDLHLLNFLKWDLLFAFAAMALAMFWFTRNGKQFVAVLTWYILSIPTLGFGAAIMGVAIWRDGVLA